VSVPPLGAASRITRLGARSFELRHSTALTAAGGGEDGLLKMSTKAAHLCSILGFRYVVAEAIAQYQSPASVTSTRWGSTVATVTCYPEEEPSILDGNVDVQTVDLSDLTIRKQIEAALQRMEAEEERDRRREEKRLAKGPEWLAEQERKAAKEEEKFQARMLRLEEEAFEKATKKLERKADKRRGSSATPPV